MAFLFRVSGLVILPATARSRGRTSVPGLKSLFDREGWLGRQDSNLGMAVPKTAALPLGYAPPRWRSSCTTVAALLLLFQALCRTCTGQAGLKPRRSGRLGCKTSRGRLMMDWLAWCKARSYGDRWSMRTGRPCPAGVLGSSQEAVSCRRAPGSESCGPGIGNTKMGPHSRAVRSRRRAAWRACGDPAQGTFRCMVDQMVMAARAMAGTPHARYGSRISRHGRAGSVHGVPPVLLIVIAPPPSPRDRGRYVPPITDPAVARPPPAAETSTAMGRDADRHS